MSSKMQKGSDSHEHDYHIHTNKKIPDDIFDYVSVKISWSSMFREYRVRMSCSEIDLYKVFGNDKSKTKGIISGLEGKSRHGKKQQMVLDVADRVGKPLEPRMKTNQKTGARIDTNKLVVTSYVSPKRSEKRYALSTSVRAFSFFVENHLNGSEIYQQASRKASQYAKNRHGGQFWFTF